MGCDAVDWRWLCGEQTITAFFWRYVFTIIDKVRCTRFRCLCLSLPQNLPFTRQTSLEFFIELEDPLYRL
jgi:hypothetical protein